jgi:Cd2+/Zn2+-exporting ATPase
MLTKKIVWQNIIFVLVIKLLVLISAALGYSNMLFAIFADVGVSLLTIINTFRILKKQK